MLTTIRQALHLMGRDQRRRWVFLLALAVVTSLVEIVAAAMVYVLLSLVANPSGTVQLPVLGDLRRFFPGVPERTLILWLIGIMVLFFLLRAAFVLVSEYISSRVVQNAAARLSIRLVRGYLSLPYAFHLQRNSAEFIRNGHQAVFEVIASVFLPLIRLTAEVIMALGILALLVAVSPLGTVLAIAVVGSSTVLLLVFVQPRMRRTGARGHAMQMETLRALQHSLQGVRDIKLLGREKYFTESYAAARMKLARVLNAREVMSQFPRLVIETSLVGFILIFFAVTIALGSSGTGMLSTLGLFGYAGLRLQPSLQKIIAALNSIRFSTAPTADIHRDLMLIEEYAKKEREAAPFPFSKAIELKGVSFGYETADGAALSDIDLTIRRGEQIGICGPTGGGKTTLVDLITGLLTPTAGTVTVDGKDIADNIPGWQRNLGVVPQMVFLTDDTLRRNIALGIPDDQIDEAAVAEAVRLAQLEPFLAGLPQGLDTLVGERGVRVSGGERQRIAIARALYARPQVLIFDEGTSALDNLTEQELMSSLERLRGDHTILLVAHRLSTLHNSDRVALIRDGRLAGLDSFEGLRAHNEFFRQMAGVG